MQYQEIVPLHRSAAEAAEQRNDPKELAVAIIAVALHEDDLTFAQQFCARLAAHSEAGVRGNAILGFGHLARRFRKLDVSSVVPLVEKGLKDSDEYVRGQAYSAAEDLNHFLGLGLDV